MGVWARPAGGEAKNITGDAGGYTGYMKFRDDYTVQDEDQRQRNAQFREAADKCSGKSQNAFRQCMSEEL